MRVKRSKYCDMACNFCKRVVVRTYADDEEELFRSALDPSRTPIETTDHEIDTSKPTGVIEEQLKKQNINDFHIGSAMPDGNCMFRAVLKASGIDDRRHLELREDVVEYMKVNFSEPSL
jgi:hypothetical protein